MYIWQILLIQSFFTLKLNLDAPFKYPFFSISCYPPVKIYLSFKTNESIYTGWLPKKEEHSTFQQVSGKWNWGSVERKLKDWRSNYLLESGKVLKAYLMWWFGLNNIDSRWSLSLCNWVVVHLYFCIDCEVREMQWWYLTILSLFPQDSAQESDLLYVDK